MRPHGLDFSMEENGNHDRSRAQQRVKLSAGRDQIRTNSEKSLLLQLAMAATFSWSDTFQIAFSTCLPCLAKPANPEASASSDSLDNPAVAHRIPRARADELQGLLAESDAEAERMSLHSNPGRKKKRMKRKKDKRITLFGYDLFGHAPPPIQLPESDDEGGSRGLGVPTPSTRTSSLTFDSDAAPLDSSTIASISVSAAALRAREEAEEEERRARAERREKRRQRKELERVAKALALAEQGEDFEGFQGSGSVFHTEDYGPFVRARAREDDEDIDEDVDLDGGVYARRNNSGAGSGSDSRSRTSASRSQRSQSDQPPQHQLQPSEIMGPVAPRRKKSKSKSSTTSRSTTSRASRSNTSASTLQSSTLLSPASPTFSANDPFPRSKLYNAEDFDGSQGFSEADLPSPAIRGGFPSPGLRGFPSSGFTGFSGSGFGGSHHTERRDSLLAKGGAFLATRGDVDDFEG